MPRKTKRPVVVSELDESAYLRKMLGLHPGLVYIRNPAIGRGVRQWVVADKDACESAAILVWRGVTVISAGPSKIMVAGIGRQRMSASTDAWAPSVPGLPVVEIWEAKQMLQSVQCHTSAELAEEIRKGYDMIGADER